MYLNITQREITLFNINKKLKNVKFYTKLIQKCCHATTLMIFHINCFCRNFNNLICHMKFCDIARFCKTNKYQTIFFVYII